MRDFRHIILRACRAALITAAVVLTAVLLWITTSDDIRHDAIYAPIEVSR